LSTIQDADVICVLEQGQLVESGTHWELLSRPDGRYAELVMKMQQQAQQTGEATADHAGDRTVVKP
jgi:ABC-type transport system involved in cytochrome bd biosynthesis fused ATPase/permease subunit